MSGGTGRAFGFANWRDVLPSEGVVDAAAFEAWVEANSQFESSPGSVWLERLRTAVTRQPPADGLVVTVQRWLAGLEAVRAGGPVARGGRILEWLRAERPWGQVDVRTLGPPGAEAWAADLLEDALRAARAGVELAERFTAAVQDARLEALRELAYGAGHEINNPLANIAARAQTLLLDEQAPDRRRRLAAIVDQAFRARDMIGSLMVFARPARPEPSVVGLTELLGGVLAASRERADQRSVRLAFSPPPAPVMLWVDRGQIEECIRALVLNAIEAVRERGNVTIIGSSAELQGNGLHVVQISDDGPGMDADTVRKAFDPFFSGREAGRGIGLGLSKALRLTEINAEDLTQATLAQIVLESRVGRGTKVTLLLPGSR